MSAEIRVPSMGESIVDAVIATWLKSEGDVVRQGEMLVELETDKVNVEVSAEQDGVLQKISRHEGDTVSVGEVLGEIGEATAATKAVPATRSEAQSASAQAVKDGRSLNAGRANSGALADVRPASDDQRPPSPLARRIAAENNVDLSRVRGSSSHGRITKDDVISYIEESSQPTSPVQRLAQQPSPAAPQVRPAAGAAAASQPGGHEERVRLSRRRLTIAQRLVEAQHTAAMLTTFNEIDMSAVMEVRARRKESFKERHNIPLGFMSFFTRAVVGALKAFPRVNAEISGNEMILKRYYDIGIAVGAEEGLVVPVLRDADRKSFAAIEREIAELAQKARANTLALSELQGGTFTITNGGIFGSLLSTPILNAPQVGILGMHKIEQRPIALNGQVVIRPMMYVALSYDHRIVDGREAVQFLVRVKELVEDPETLLLEG